MSTGKKMNKRELNELDEKIKSFILCALNRNSLNRLNEHLNIVRNGIME